MKITLECDCLFKPLHLNELVWILLPFNASIAVWTSLHAPHLNPSSFFFESSFPSSIYLGFLPFVVTFLAFGPFFFFFGGAFGVVFEWLQEKKIKDDYY